MLMGRWAPLVDNGWACPVTLAHCCRGACTDGCGFIGGWPPPPDEHDKRAEPSETLPQPAHWFRGSYCSYCIHTRAEHGGDEGICVRCITDGNGFWPLCPAFTRTAKTPDEHPGLRAGRDVI